MAESRTRSRSASRTSASEPAEIWPRVEEALALVGAEQLAERSVARAVRGRAAACVARVGARAATAAAPARRADVAARSRRGRDVLRPRCGALDCAVLLSEQRPARPLERATASSSWSRGASRLDAAREEAVAWLRSNRPLYLPHAPELACRLAGVRFSYGDRLVLDGASLEVRRGEIVALTGPNGVGKTTLAKIAAGLLEADDGEVRARAGRLPVPGPGPSPRHRTRARRGRARRRRHACAERAREGRAGGERGASSARPLLRRARAAGAGGGARDRARAARARRADAWRRPRAQGRSWRALLRAEAPSRGTLVVTHDLPWAPRSPTGSSRSTSGRPSVRRLHRRRGRRCSPLRSSSTTARSRRCSAREPWSRPASRGSSRGRTRRASLPSSRRSPRPPPRGGCSSQPCRACSR